MALIFILLTSFLTGAAEVSSGGGLDRDQVATAMQRGTGPMIKCYETQLTKNPKLEGRVDVSLEVNAEGLVDKCEVSKSTLKNKAAEDCVVTECKKLVFPKPAGGKAVRVTYPYEFKRLAPKK